MISPSKQILKAYLKAGTTFPQVRGTINISLCSFLADIWDQKEILQFFRSELSPDQTKAITVSMNKLHEMGGIVISIEQTKQLIDLEWRKSRGAVMATFLRFFRNETTLSTRGQNLKTYINSENLDKISLILSSESPERVECFRNIVKTACNLMYSQKELASLFRMVLYEEPQRNLTFEKKTQFYKNILAKHKIDITPLSDTNASICKKECLNVLNQYIKKNLASHFPNSVAEIDAIVWGI